MKLDSVEYSGPVPQLMPYVDKLPLPTVPTAPVVLATRYSRLRPENWAPLIVELLSEPDLIGTICEKYKTSPVEVDHLKANNQGFMNQWRDLEDKFNALGRNAGFQLRATLLAERSLPELGKLAETSKNDQTKLRAIENIMRLARVDPQTERAVKDSGGKVAAAGVAVTVNFGPGMPTIPSLEVSKIVNIGGEDESD